MESMDENDVHNPIGEDHMNAEGEVTVRDENFCSFEMDVDDSMAENSSYTVLSEEDIRRRMEDVITGVSTVLSVSKGEASILLRYYKWSIAAVTEAWFLNEIETRKRVGLLKNSPGQFPSATSDFARGICSECHSGDGITWANCAHHFCGNCWANHIGTQLSAPTGVFLAIRCPHPSCGSALSQEMIETIATEEQRENFSRYLLRSFVEHSKSIKWCPREGCKYAIDLALSASSSEVTCLCSHSFCWSCNNECHHPVNCDTVARWMCTISDPELSTGNMLLITTKPCPKCSRLIENSDGNNRVTCISPCFFDFCWECLEAWDNEWGFHTTCNQQSELSNQIQKQQESTRRYFSCFDGWVSNEISKSGDLFELETVKREHFSQRLAKVEVEFLVEALKEIVKCRQILKWTYVYKYFIPENEEGKIQLFDFLQEQAVDALERLHSSADHGVWRSILTNSDCFNEFYRQVIQLTRVTRKYFRNLVEALENDLSEVKSKSERPPNIKISDFSTKKERDSGCVAS